MDAATSASSAASALASNRLLEHHPGCRIPSCFCELWPSIVYNPSGPMYPKRYIDKFAEDEVQYAKQKLQAKAERAAKVRESVSNQSASVAKSKRKRTAGEDELADDDDDGDSKYARHRDLMVRDLIECCLEAVPMDVLHSIPSSTFRGDVDEAIEGKTVMYRLRDRIDFRRYPGLRDYLLNRHRNSLWQDSLADVEAVIRMLEAGTVTGKLTLGHITDLKHPLRVLNVDSAAGAFATVPLRAGEPLGVYPGVLTPYNELNGFMGRLPMSDRSKIWSYDIEAPINGYSFHGAGVRNVLCGVNDFHGIDDEEGNSVSKVPLKLGGVIPMILFVTRRAIAQGQELTLSYGHEWSKVFTTYHPAAREIFFANKRDNEPSIGEMYQLVGLARAERTRSSLKLKAAGGADAVAAEMQKRATKVSQLKSASKLGPGSGSPSVNGLSCDTSSSGAAALGLAIASEGGGSGAGGGAGLTASPAGGSSSTTSAMIGDVAAMSSGGGHEAQSGAPPGPRMPTSSTYVPSPLAAVQRARESTASALGGAVSASSLPAPPSTPAGSGASAATGSSVALGLGPGVGVGGTKMDFMTQIAAAVSTGKLALAPGATASDEAALRARVASVGHYDHLGAGIDLGQCPDLTGTSTSTAASSASASSSAAGKAAGTHSLLLHRFKAWEEASKKLNFAVAARVAVAEAAAVAAQRAKRAAALALQRAEEGRKAAAAAAAASPPAKPQGKRKSTASKSGTKRAVLAGQSAGTGGRGSSGAKKGSAAAEEEDEEEEGQDEELDEEDDDEDADAGAPSSPAFVPPPPPVLPPLPAEPSLQLVDVSEVLASLDALDEARASSPTGGAAESSGSSSSGDERYNEVLAALLCKAVEAGVTMIDGTDLVPGIILPSGASGEQGAEPSPKEGVPQPSPTASASSAASGTGFVPLPMEPRRTAVLARIREWVDEQREVANTYADALDAREAALAAHASAVATAQAEAAAAAAAAAAALKGKGKSQGKKTGGKSATQGKRPREDASTSEAHVDSQRKKQKESVAASTPSGPTSSSGTVAASSSSSTGGAKEKKADRAARKAAKKALKAAKAAKKAGRKAASSPAAAPANGVMGTPAGASANGSGGGGGKESSTAGKRAASSSTARKDKSGSSTAKKARLSTAADSAPPAAAAAAAAPVDVMSLGTQAYNSFLSTLPAHLQEAVAIPGLSRIQQRQLLASMLAEHVSAGSSSAAPAESAHDGNSKGGAGAGASASGTGSGSEKKGKAKGKAPVAAEAVAASSAAGSSEGSKGHTALSTVTVEGGDGSHVAHGTGTGTGPSEAQSEGRDADMAGTGVEGVEATLAV